MLATSKTEKEQRKYPRGKSPNSRKAIERSTWRPGQSGNPKGRPLGSRDRATVYKNLLDLPTDVTLPNEQQETVSLYEAAALGQIKSAMQGNTNAWKEIQDSLHGKIPDKHEIIHSENETLFSAFRDIAMCLLDELRDANEAKKQALALLTEGATEEEMAELGAIDIEAVVLE